MKRFFRLLSAVLHPMLVPTLALSVIFATDPFTMAAEQLKWASVVVFGGTYVLPALMIGLLLALGAIESPELHKAQERRWPLIFGVLFSGSTFAVLRYAHVHPMLERFLWTTTLLLVVASIVTPRTKISLHGMAMGALTALVWVQCIRSATLHLSLLAGVILASGLVGVARLYLKAHTPFQWYLGYFSGFFLALYTLTV